MLRNFIRIKGKLSIVFLGLACLVILIVILTKGSQKPSEITDPTPVHIEQPIDTSPTMQAVRAYSEFLLSELDSSGTVGAAFTIVHDGKIVRTGTFGIRQAGKTDRIDEHTIFRLASVSKGFAGALSCMLEEEGLISLEEKVADHYTGFRLKDSVNTTDLTIRQILSHTSGLVPYAFDNLVEAGIDLDKIAERLAEVDISAPPGELYGYQNVIFSLIDPILEDVTGRSYADLLEQKIFRPLGMSDASAGLLKNSPEVNIAYPHIRVAGGYVADELHEGYYNVMPAAGVNASISDMGQWLLALLGSKEDYFPDKISQQLADPIIYTPLKARYTRAWKPFRDRYYSLGWRIYHYQGREIVCHGGYVRGYRAEIAFCPSENVGIAFLQNSPNGVAAKSLPAFFDLLIEKLDNETYPVAQSDTIKLVELL